MIRTNEKKLAKFKLQGSIMPMKGYGWEVCHDGKPRTLPSVGGIVLNFKVGDLANMYAADHLEPGVTTTTDASDSGKAGSRHNVAYNTFSCIGNEALVISGKAKRAKGRVTGHHGGCEHVLIDFDQKTLEKLSYDDKIEITSHGCGLEIEGFEGRVRSYSLSPELLKKMNIKLRSGRLHVGVAAIIPAVVMGSGLGSSDPFKGDYDIQTSDAETNRKYGLDKLRLGDIVAIMDHDSAFGWSYKKGAVSIGVVIHGDSMIAGHGPGCQTILTCLGGEIMPARDANANIGKYLKLGRYR
ncbi:MAG: hypothetical protein A2583_15850 [Bdellovibrionales bacterium RIFOXYD1_FULL_53_11]|nr:MAG: hypothetical protein A2583_15850 [Bdellovibrionales bacterium RIFOXYD1_FULL_53_11]